jgi:hypothetical protein
MARTKTLFVNYLQGTLVPVGHSRTKVRYKVHDKGRFRPNYIVKTKKDPPHRGEPFLFNY